MLWLHVFSKYRPRQPISHSRVITLAPQLDFSKPLDELEMYIHWKLSGKDAGDIKQPEFKFVGDNDVLCGDASLHLKLYIKNNLSNITKQNCQE